MESGRQIPRGINRQTACHIQTPFPHRNRRLVRCHRSGWFRVWNQKVRPHLVSRIADRKAAPRLGWTEPLGGSLSYCRLRRPRPRPQLSDLCRSGGDNALPSPSLCVGYRCRRATLAQRLRPGRGRAFVTTATARWRATSAAVKRVLVFVVISQYLRSGQYPEMGERISGPVRADDPSIVAALSVSGR